MRCCVAKVKPAGTLYEVHIVYATITSIGQCGPMYRFATRLACVAQIAVSLGAVFILAFAPPERGAMRLVSFTGHVPVARIVRAHDALLLGRDGSGRLVVRGERAALFWPLLRRGVLAVAVPSGWCGAAR